MMGENFLFDNKFMFILSLVCLISLFIVPLSFAESLDNSTLQLDENQSLISYSQDENVLSASNDYYFDASALDDSGDGSVSSPYKYLTADRIKGNCNIYLKDGEYNLDASKSIERVNIIGSSHTGTILKYYGNAFTVNSMLTLTNITLQGISITNYATLNATNTVFSEGYGTRFDSYGNVYGGAICTRYLDESNANAKVTLNNCTFHDNFAIYGGAIYAETGSLEIVNSNFIDNFAYNFGGAIACEDTLDVTISKSKFIRNYCVDDAGGAIYIKASRKFNGDYLEIFNSSATFGAAITTLNCDVNLNHVNAENNAAKWDGGAIYHMYGKFSLYQSNFINNSARNGGALFIDNSTSLSIRSNAFVNNTATDSAGAIYSLLNKLNSVPSVKLYNNFKNNDVVEINNLNLQIGNGNYTLYVSNDTQITDLPSRYNSYDKNYLTVVKDQQNGGNCWAFTAMAVLESCIKKMTGQELDLSEENMKNVMAMYSDYGWQIDSNQGGFDSMQYGYLTSWLGPINEIDDVYDDKSVLSSLFNSILHVQNIQFFKRQNATDNDAIKNAIMMYGAVGTSMFFDSYYLNNGDSYYTWVSLPSNHAVTIVGWDDNYSQNNFKFGSYSGGDGAWIVRNSWGPYWANDGYFYVSYYDSKLAQVGIDEAAYAIIFNDTVRLDKNYQYDIAGRTDYLYDDNPSVWYKNRFTSTDNEILTSVSTYFEKITNWTVSVYVNNVLKTVKNGISPAGYWTINLDEMIQLYAGDMFEIVFNTTCDGISAMPISEKSNLNKLIYSPEVSYVSYDGENWQDLYSFSGTYATHKYYGGVACIKAFTQLIDLNTTTYLDVIYDGFNPVNVTATVIDQYGNAARGIVVLNLSGKQYTIQLADGKASIIHNFEKGINEISCLFESKGYISSSNHTSIEISMKEVTLNVNLTQNMNSLTVEVTASENINEKIIISINNKNHTVKLRNGHVEFVENDLANGNYTVEAILQSNVWQADSISKELEISMKKTYIELSDFITGDFSEDICSIYLFDDDKNPIPDKTVTFTINGKKYNETTDSYGRVSTVINLARGEYDVVAAFEGDNNYFSSINSSSIKVLTFVDANIRDITYQNNALINISLSKPINTTFTLEINGRNQSVSIVDGCAIVNLTDLDNGDYTIKGYMDELFEYDINLLKFNIDVKNTQITVNSIINDTNLNCTVTLLDEDGNPISGKQVEIKLNNRNFTRISDENGNANINLDLEKGDYAIMAAFNGDNNLFGSSNSSQITINPTLEVLSIDKVVRNNKLYVDVVFSRPIVAAAILWIGDNYFILNIEDGKASITDFDLDNDNYTAYVQFLFDEFNYINKTFDLPIFIKKTQLIANELITTENSNENFTVTLLDEDDNPIVDQYVSLLIGTNMVYNVKTNEMGQIFIPINLEFGDYPVLIKFYPMEFCDTYYSSTNRTNIIVKKAISANVNVSKYQNNANVSISFTKPINDTVNVSLNGINQTVKLTEGIGSISFTDLNNGDYALKVHFDDDNYMFSPVEQSFSINVNPAVIVGENFITYYQSGEYCSIRLMDENGLPLSDKLLVIELNGNSFANSTDDEGVVLVPINLKTGIYNLKVSFTGDDEYLPLASSLKIVVNSSISFTNTQYTLNSKMTIFLSGNITGQAIDVLINGGEHKFIGNDGFISINVDFNVGTYAMQITNPLTGEVKNQTITVLPRLSDNGNVVMYYGADKECGVHVFDDNANVVSAGEIVEFKINGKINKVKTNNKGYASFSLNNLKAGKYTIEFSYKGFRTSSKITVKPTLITKNKKFKKAKTIKYTAKLLNKNGKVLKGKKITFKVKGKTYKAKTNKKGIATIKIKNLKVGKYKVVSKYGKQKSTSKITIKK